MKKILGLSFLLLITACGQDDTSLLTNQLDNKLNQYVEEREPNFVQTLNASGIQEPNVNNIFRFGKVNKFLYRGGLPTESDLKALKDFKVKTVVSFRGLGDDKEKFQIAEEKAIVEKLGMKFLNIQIPFDKPVPDKTIKSFFTAVNTKSNQPLFVHCKGGRDRTGTMVALYRIKYEGFTPDKAIEEMKEYTFNPIDYPIFTTQISNFKANSIK
jgi:tyrosine-protein phosphatase SIW14